MTRKIIIDTDPGQDDAIAILLALASGDALDVLGITTVAGNVPLPLTSRNARMVCELCGREDIPVHAGARRPISGRTVTAEHVHGKTGLDGAKLDEPSMQLQSRLAIEFIADQLRVHEAGEITLCCLGPLTNIAAFLTEYPDLKARIGRIVMMGGAYFEVGNITPTAEFNIFADPQAAEIVFSSGLDLVVVPLDVTHRLLLTPSRLQAFRDIGSRIGHTVADWAGFFERHDIEKYGSDGAPLHDPAVIAYLLDPTLFTGRYVNVAIETDSELTRGMTVIDWWKVTDRPPNAQVMGAVDTDGFFELLTERLRAFGDGADRRYRTGSEMTCRQAV